MIDLINTIGFFASIVALIGCSTGAKKGSMIAITLLLVGSVTIVPLMLGVFVALGR